jgi:hypothetical protein
MKAEGFETAQRLNVKPREAVWGPRLAEAELR